jgi:hypothetical protein
MTDELFWGLYLVGGLTIAFTIAILASCVWAVIAHRPDPWDRLPERMRAAGEWEQGRRLAGQRDDLIAQGVDPADLLIPLAPRGRP